MEGPPVAYNWAVAGVMSPWLPWLAILGLLALKSNHGWSAWWIWLPLAGLAAGWHCLELALQNSKTGLPEGVLGILLNVPVALAFGLAALWLLASHLGRCHRLGTFLGTLAVLVAFTMFSFAAAAGWGLGMESIMSILIPRQAAATAVTGELALPFFVLPVLLALAVAATLALCGLAGRWRHRPAWLCLWFILFLPAICVAMAGLLDFLCRVISPGSLEFPLFLTIRALHGGGYIRHLVAVSGSFPGQCLVSGAAQGALAPGAAKACSWHMETENMPASPGAIEVTLQRRPTLVTASDCVS